MTIRMFKNFVIFEKKQDVMVKNAKTVQKRQFLQ